MRHQSIEFSVSPEMNALESLGSEGWRGTYFAMGGMTNGSEHDDLEALKAEAAREALARFTPESLRDDPVLDGFRALHRAVGCANRKTIPSPENLLRFVLRSGALPRVNLLVDIYNLVSIRSRLALGAHDLAGVEGDITLRLTDGSEGFHPLGESAPKAVAAGEYAYIDGANDVLCRLEVRQVEKSKVGADTRECFYIVQGNGATDQEDLRAAAEEVVALNQRFCGGEVRWLYGGWLENMP